MNANVYVVSVDDNNTLIYQNGLILKEYSACIVKREAGLRLVEAGNACYKIKELDGADLITPVVDGAIVNVEAAALMLKSFLNKVVKKNIFNKTEIIVPVSAALSIVEREAFESAFLKAGYKNVKLIESIFGLVPFVNEDGQAVIEFRQGTTEFGIVGKNGIVAACSASVGEKRINKMLIEAVLDIHNVHIGELTSHKLRERLLSLYDNDTSIMEAAGQDILDGKNKNIEISAKSLKPVAVKFLRIITDIFESLVASLPANVLEDVRSKGVFIAGSIAEIRGLCEYLEKYLKMPVFMDKDESETICLKGLFL